MFSGIVENQTTVLSAVESSGLVRIEVEKPAEFDDLKIGDSIATNGVCLTVEKFDERSITFALGAETLKITGWTARRLQGMHLNLERSLRLGDRIHGHMVSGHVDATATVVRAEDAGGSRFMDFALPSSLAPYVWVKGSCTIDGVSLTVNTVVDSVIGVCLIPETLKRTTLASRQKGDRVNIEVDWMARGLMRVMEMGVPFARHEEG